jgi:hypothetical protein
VRVGFNVCKGEGNNLNNKAETPANLTDNRQGFFEAVI